MTAQREKITQQIAKECMHYSLNELRDAMCTVEALGRGLLRAASEKKRLGLVTENAYVRSEVILVTIDNPTHIHMGLEKKISPGNPQINSTAVCSMCQSVQTTTIPKSIFSEDFPTELAQLLSEGFPSEL